MFEHSERNSKTEYSDLKDVQTYDDIRESGPEIHP